MPQQVPRAQREPGFISVTALFCRFCQQQGVRRGAKRGSAGSVPLLSRAEPSSPSSRQGAVLVERLGHLWEPCLPPCWTSSEQRSSVCTVADGGSSSNFSLFQELRETRSSKQGWAWLEGQQRRVSPGEQDPVQPLEGQSTQSW